MFVIDPITVPVIILLVMAGLLISSLGAMIGLGGGFLMVPFLVLVMGMPHQEAVATSLAMIFVNSSSSSLANLRAGLVEIKKGLLYAVPAIPGLFIGFSLLKNMSPNAFRLSFSLLLLLVLSYLVYQERKGKITERDIRIESGRVRLVLPYVLSFLAGILSSTFGIGGGLIFVPVFVLVVGKGMKGAIASSMFVIALITATRIAFVSHEGMDLVITLSLVLGAIIGGQVGSRVMRRMRSRQLLYILVFCMFCIAVYMGSRAMANIV